MDPPQRDADGGLVAHRRQGHQREQHPQLLALAALRRRGDVPRIRRANGLQRDYQRQPRRPSLAPCRRPLRRGPPAHVRRWCVAGQRGLHDYPGGQRITSARRVRRRIQRVRGNDRACSTPQRGTVCNLDCRPRGPQPCGAATGRVEHRTRVGIQRDTRNASCLRRQRQREPRLPRVDHRQRRP